MRNSLPSGGISILLRGCNFTKMTTLIILTALALGFLAAFLLFSAIRVFCVNTAKYHKNKARSQSLLSVFRGDLLRDQNERRPIIQSGIAINAKNEWVEQGRLSDEAVKDILRKI